MSQRHNDNPIRLTVKQNQPGILKIYTFCQKIQQRAVGPGESTVGVTVSIYVESIYLSTEYTWKVAACCPLPPLKILTILLSISSGVQLSIVVTWLRLVSRLHANTSSPDLYCRKRPNWHAYLELCLRNPDIQMLNQMALINSTTGKCEQVIKQVLKTHASYNTTRTSWENINNWGTKMILLSDELWLIANNSKSFPN